MDSNDLDFWPLKVAILAPYKEGEDFETVDEEHVVSQSDLNATVHLWNVMEHGIHTMDMQLKYLQ